MSNVAVLIPTLRRPESLARAVRSLFAQTGVQGRLREIVVVDNDPQGSAGAAIQAMMAGAPFPLAYVREPRPGVATARNAGLAAVEAPLIAFLDDDETASPGWLAALIESSRAVRCGRRVRADPGRAPRGDGRPPRLSGALLLADRPR